MAIKITFNILFKPKFASGIEDTLWTLLTPEDKYQGDGLYQVCLPGGSVRKSGAFLMNFGLEIRLSGDYDSCMILIEQEAWHVEKILFPPGDSGTGICSGACIPALFPNLPCRL